MRTFRLFLAAALIAAVGVAAIPVGASAATGQASLSNFETKQNKRIKTAKRKAKKANKKANNALDGVAALGDTLDDVQNAVKVITDAAPQLISGLQALRSALENDVAPALTAINDALTDPVTGLVGLNLARPQFGAFEGVGGTPGNMIDGTGRHGGQGPDSDADVNGGLDQYVVDFNNDVSAKSLVVNVAPQDPLGAGPTPHGEAVGCNAHAAIQAACSSILGLTAGEYNEDEYVLVELDAPPVLAFTVTALSG